MSTVLVTGASRGIGRAIAEEFAGADTAWWPPHVIRARWPDLNVSERLALDVTDDASVTAAFAAAGDVDIVIVNPAEIFYAAVEAIPLTELQRLFNLNTVGAIRVAQAVLPQMRARGDGQAALHVQRGWAHRIAARRGLCVHQVGTRGAGRIPGDRGCPVRRPGGPDAARPGELRALDDVTTYTLPADPYAEVDKGGGPREGMITPEQAAAEFADAAEEPQLPLRIPIGDPARALLAARHAAPDDVPFVPTAG